MATIDIKCSNCSGEIQVDESKKQIFCMHCGTEIDIQEDVKNFKTEEPVIVEEVINLDDLITNGVVLIDQNQNKKAISIFETATHEYPKDFRGWWGLAYSTMRYRWVEQIKVKNLTQFRPFHSKQAITDMYDDSVEYLNNAIDTSPSDEHRSQLENVLRIADQTISQEKSIIDSSASLEKLKKTYLVRFKKKTTANIFFENIFKFFSSPLLVISVIFNFISGSSKDTKTSCRYPVLTILYATSLLLSVSVLSTSLGLYKFPVLFNSPDYIIYISTIVLFILGFLFKYIKLRFGYKKVEAAQQLLNLEVEEINESLRRLKEAAKEIKL